MSARREDSFGKRRPPWYAGDRLIVTSGAYTSLPPGTVVVVDMVMVSTNDGVRSRPPPVRSTRRWYWSVSVYPDGHRPTVGGTWALPFPAAPSPP